MEMDQARQKLPAMEQDFIVGFSYKIAFFGILFCVGIVFCLILFQEALLRDWSMLREIEVNGFAHLVLPLIAVLGLSNEIWYVAKPLLFGRGPALVINRSGMYFTKLPWRLGKAFIAWSEIKAIYSYHTSKEKYFCISPKVPQQDLVLSGRGKRRFQTICSQTDALINIPEYMIALPVSTIIQQINTQYAQELSENEIRIWND